MLLIRIPACRSLAFANRKHDMAQIKLKYSRSQRGVETAELALCLPLVIFIIFGTIDISRILATYSSLRTATAIGARQAVGQQRDEPAVVSTMMSSMSGGYYSGTPSGSAFQNDAFVVPGTSDATAEQYTKSCTGQPLSIMYRYEVRALAYANYILTSNFPNTPYPCGDGSQECFNCCLLRGSNDLYTKVFSLTSVENTPVLAAKFVGIKCNFKLPMRTASFTLGAMPSTINIEASAYIPVNNYAGNQFDAQ